jgi:putative transposase
MQLAERHIKVGDKAIEDICFKSARLYNFCNYYKRMVCFGQLEKFSEYELSGLLAEYKQEDFKSLPAQTSQQVIKLLFKNWKSYFLAIKKYKKSSSGFSGRPKLPKYKDKKGYFVVMFTKQQLKIKEGFIHFPKQTGLSP